MLSSHRGVHGRSLVVTAESEAHGMGQSLDDHAVLKAQASWVLGVRARGAGVAT